MLSKRNLKLNIFRPASSLSFWVLTETIHQQLITRCMDYGVISTLWVYGSQTRATNFLKDNSIRNESYSPLTLTEIATRVHFHRPFMDRFFKFSSTFFSRSNK